jgi:prepilin signal peptidase PulO-like enzyme (type II secretory pathway)
VAAQANTDAGSIRNAICWGLLLAATATIGFRLPRLVHYFRNWREALRLVDTSGAAGWRTFLYVEAMGLLIVMAIGLGAFYALRPRGKSRT